MASTRTGEHEVRAYFNGQEIGQLQTITVDRSTIDPVIYDYPRTMNREFSGTLTNASVDTDALLEMMQGFLNTPAKPRDNEHYAEKKLEQW